LREKIFEKLIKNSFFLIQNKKNIKNINFLKNISDYKPFFNLKNHGLFTLYDFVLNIFSF